MMIIIQATMFIVLSCAEISASSAHSDHTLMQCTAPGSCRLNGDSLGHTHIKFSEWLPEALRHHHHLVNKYYYPSRRLVLISPSVEPISGLSQPNTAGKSAAGRVKSRRSQRVQSAGASRGWIRTPVYFVMYGKERRHCQ